MIIFTPVVLNVVVMSEDGGVAETGIKAIAHILERRKLVLLLLVYVYGLFSVRGFAE